MQSEDWLKSYDADDEKTSFIVDYKGNAIMFGYCATCGQPYTIPTERPFNFCGYCGLRIIYDKEDN